MLCRVEGEGGGWGVLQVHDVYMHIAYEANGNNIPVLTMS